MPQKNIKYPDTAMNAVANAIAVTIATDFDAMGHRDSRLDHGKTRFAVEGAPEGLLTCYWFESFPGALHRFFPRSPESAYTRIRES